jgi:hypothetical protein
VFSIREDLSKKKRLSEVQIVRIPGEAEASGAEVRAVCRKNNITEQAFYCWRNKCGDMDVPRLRELIKPVAGPMLVIDDLKEFSGKR